MNTILSAVNRLHRQHVHAEQLEAIASTVGNLERVIQVKHNARVNPAAGLKTSAAKILNNKLGKHAAAQQVAAQRKVWYDVTH